MNARERALYASKSDRSSGTPTPKNEASFAVLIDEYSFRYDRITGIIAVEKVFFTNKNTASKKTPTLLSDFAQKHRLLISKRLQVQISVG